MLDDKFISIDELKLGEKRFPWKIGLSNGRILDETFLGLLCVNPVNYEVTKQRSVAYEWQVGYTTAITIISINN